MPMNTPLKLLYISQDPTLPEPLKKFFLKDQKVKSKEKRDVFEHYLGWEVCVASLEHSSGDLLLVDWSPENKTWIRHLKVFLKEFPKIPVIISVKNYESQLTAKFLKMGVEDVITHDSLDPPTLERVFHKAKIRHTATLSIKSKLEAANLEAGRFHSLIMATTNLVWFTDSQGNIVEKQPAWERFTGQEWPAMKGWGWVKKLIEEKIKNFEEILEDSINKKEIIHYETQLWHHESQTFRPVLLRIVPYFDTKGKVFGWIGTITQLDVVKTIEDSLKARIRQLEVVQKITKFGLWDWDIKKDTAVCSPEVYELFGFDPNFNPPSFKNLMSLIPEEQKSGLQASMDKALAEKGDFNYVLQTTGKNQTLKYIQSVGRVHCDAEGVPAHMVGVSLDITRQKETELERQRLLEIIEQSSDCVGIGDFKGHPTYINKAGLELLGLDSVEEAQGHYVWDFYPDELQTKIKTEVMPALANEGKFFGELTIQNKKTGKKIPTHCNAFRINDSITGKPVCLANFTRDIRDLKQLDREKEEFIHTVSHEMRTPLSILTVAIQNIAEKLTGPLTPLQEKTLGVAIRNSQRLSRIVDNILNLSNLESGKITLNLEAICLKNLIDPVIQDIRKIAEKDKIEIETRISNPQTRISVDVEQIQRVLFNLVGNALRFAKKNIIVSTIEKQSEGSANQLFERDPCVEIVISDDGPGISLKDQKNLFNKFIQINRPQGGEGYKGTGLGLAICKKIINYHLGEIWVESLPQHGASFHFTLPKKY